MATAFGVVSGFVTIIGFALSLIPGDSGRATTTYRFYAALDRPSGPSNAGGDAPDIRVWNEGGQFMGAVYDPGKVGTGSWRDVTVRLDRSNQPTYSLFTGNDDAVCLAYITQTWDDGQKYGWVGNWARTCGRTWYYSNVVVDGKDLDCAWLDRDGDLPVTAFQTHIHEFSPSRSGSGNINYYCGQNPSLQFYYHWEPNSISYWVSALDGEGTAVAEGPVKPGGGAQRKARPAFNETRLVRSSTASHSAVDLCASETSSGPDLVSLHEGKFCNMKTREVLPLCGNGVTVDCFDDKTRTVVVPNGRRDVEHEEYSQVLEWGSE